MGDDLARHPADSAREPGGHGLPPGSLLLEQDFDEGSLYVLRAAVSAHGAEAGLEKGRLYDVVTVAHELAANAVRHGAGRGHLRLWLDDGLLHCEVSDAGRSSVEGGRPAGDNNTGRPAPGNAGRTGGDSPGNPGDANGDSPGSADGAQSVPWREEHGHGLWVVSRVADQFRIDRRATATIATAAFRLDAQPDREQ
jgi:anti-sigma regulatory factor (Ser/Thr protein kinase)